MNRLPARLGLPLFGVGFATVVGVLLLLWGLSLPTENGGSSGPPIGPYPFELGPPSAFSVASNGSGHGGCQVPSPRVVNFCYSLQLYVGSGILTSDLSFNLTNSMGDPVAVLSVTLEDSLGAGLALWTPAAGWAQCTAALCSSVSSSHSPLPIEVNGTERLVLFAGTEPGTGDQFVCHVFLGGSWGSVSTTLT
jgi:hypothetical protein